MLSIDLFAALEINDNNQINIALAYALMGIGPVVGTLMFIKSAGKMINAASGFMGKVGKWGQKKTAAAAKTRQERSPYGVMQNARKQAKDVAAQQRAYGKLGSGFGGRIGKFGLRKDARKAFDTRVSGLNKSVYDKEVEDETNRLSMSDEHGQTLDGAIAYARQLAASGTATKAQMHAAANNILSKTGGKTSLRNLFRDQEFMANAGSRDESWNGLATAALTNKAFAGAHPDIANAISQHGAAFRAEAQKATAAAVKTESYVDSTGTHTRKISNADAFLGANFSTATTVPHGTQPVANGTKKGWGWIAERPGQILAAADVHATHLAGQVEYQYAKAAQQSPEFVSADPEIQALINDVVFRAETAAGPGGIPDPKFK